MWDLLYYGANHTWATTYDLSENIIRCYGSLTTHCLGIPSHMFERLLKIPPVHVIDKVIADSVHHTHYCLAVWPSVLLSCCPLSDRVGRGYHDDSRDYTLLFSSHYRRQVRFQPVEA